MLAPAPRPWPRRTTGEGHNLLACRFLLGLVVMWVVSTLVCASTELLPS